MLDFIFIANKTIPDYTQFNFTELYCLILDFKKKKLLEKKKKKHF